MADLRSLTKLIDAQSSITAKLTAKLVEQLLDLWRPFDGWYDGEMVRAVSRDSASLVEAAQAEVRRQSIAALRQMYDDLDAVFPEEQIDKELLPFKYSREAGGESIEKIWERPVEQHRRLASTLRHAEGEQWAQERIDREVEQRIRDLAEMDMALAQRDQEHEVLVAEPSNDEVARARKRHAKRGRKTQKVIGWRRIIHPEESKTGSCGLCIAAATRMYGVEELKALHGGCQCTVSPVTKAEDPGLQLNAADLNRIYNAAGSTARADLRRVRPVIEENGELGPILKEDGKTEIVDDMAAKRREAIEAARAAELDDARSRKRIEDLEVRIAAARKSVAFGDKLLAKQPEEAQRAQFIRHSNLKRITRYEQELEVLTRKAAAA